MKSKSRYDFLPPYWQSLGMGVEDKEDAPQGASLSESDRSRHIFCVGSTGSGKSKLLEGFALNDIALRIIGENKRGIIFIDPHGDSADNLIDWLSVLAVKFPVINDLTIIIDPTQTAYQVGFNPLECIAGENPFDRSQALATAIMKLYEDDPSVTVRLHSVLLHSFWALSLAGKSLKDFAPFVLRANYREDILKKINHEGLGHYFVHQFPIGRNGRFNREVIDWVGSSLNRLNPIIQNPRFQRLLNPKTSTVNFKKAMQEGKIIIVRCPSGLVQEQPTYLFCALVLAAVHQAAINRQDIPSQQRTPCALYADEFLGYANSSLIKTLQETRKYGLEMILATQRVRGLTHQFEILKAALDICQTIISFRVGYEDADVLVKELFSPDVMSVKEQRTRIMHYGNLPIVTHDNLYFSLEELWHLERQKLMTLHDRQYWMKLRRSASSSLNFSKPVHTMADEIRDQPMSALRMKLHQEVANRYGTTSYVEPSAAKTYSVQQEHPKPALLNAPQTRSTDDEFGGQS